MADLNNEIRRNPFAPPVQPNPLMPPAMPPMPPPPQDPNQGFQAWASDVRNSMKVQPAMTGPTSPLQPNAQPPMSAVYNPPGATAPKPAPVPTQDQDMAAHPDAYSKTVMGSKLGKILTALAATSLGAAGGMHGDPGAGAKYAMGVKAADDQVGQDNTQTYQQRILQPQKDALNTANTQSEIDSRDARTKQQQQNYQAQLAQHGLKEVTDDKGNVTVVPDENSAAFKQQQQKAEIANAQIEVHKANLDLQRAKLEVEKAKNDPNSPAFKLAQQKLAVAQQNANAANTRATAYIGRYYQSAFNTDTKGNVLPGAPVIQDESDNQTVVGTGNAAQAVKSQANAAQFNDVHGSLDQLEKSARALTATGEKPNSALISAALSQPKGTVGQWIQGQAAKGNLTPAQRDYVTTLVAAHENIQGLRKSAGGTATDSSVDRLIQMLPNASTPDLDYFLRQTGQIRQTADRIGKGATTAAGGLSVRGQAPAPKPGPHPFTPPTQTKPQAQSGGPKVGTVEGGFRFKGGDPSKPENWEKVR